MARKISAGSAGGAALAGFQAFTTTITSAPNLDIVIDPIGTGNFLINGNTQLQNQSDLRFANANNSNYVALQAPTTIAENYTWTLPNVDGGQGQTLTTDGSGALAWSAKTINVVDNTTDSAQYNLAFTTASSGTIETITTTTSRLQFQPSTGDLTVNGTARSLLTENVQTASYTLALTDRNRVVAMNNSAAVTVTVPPNSSVTFPIGSVVNITRTGAGLVTLVAGSGVSLTNSGQLGPSEEIILRKRGTNSWQVMEERKFARTASGGTINNQTVAIAHSYTGTGASSFVVS